MTPINISYEQARILYDSGCRHIACHCYTSDGAIRYALAEQWEPEYADGTGVESPYWYYAIMVE